MTIGVFNVIMSDNKVLLVKRQDIPLWDLPGGKLEIGETKLECAVREAYEETGYKISIVYKVGEYQIKELDDIQIVYCSRIIGGTPIDSGPETKSLKFFSLNVLPIFMVPNRKKQIRDFSNKQSNQSFLIKESKLIKLLRRVKKYKFEYKDK
ncbi:MULTISPECIES: NUDIX hydrolase [Lactococcus]|jgi:8-oxo-dGTP pyrophosphatase MutT (NUDIX family)|uniref:NUDIX hydrolase n=1 Tax=Lactococcus lactis TaxID=1358 RepID=A0A443L2E0_9LACT|nr:NUDIX hydrolase [Lactococcus lactis]NYZ60059.1 NUDIX hydrolase [Lactococcus lactis]RWR42607.1 NUDIX hydrolase [Lactococcus lactis]UTG79058.1 NUDIX hydrolase [Lactococcus lactis]